MKRHKVARHTVLPAQLLTILATTKQYFVQIFGTRFHLNQTTNMRSVDRCSFTPKRITARNLSIFTELIITH